MKWQATALASILACAACATAESPFRGGEEDVGGGGTLALWVENQNVEQVRITVLGPQVAQELGEISGRRSEMFAVPWPRSGELRIRIELVLGGRRFTTPLILALPGDRVDLTVSSPLQRSFIRKR